MDTELLLYYRLQTVMQRTVSTSSWVASLRSWEELNITREGSNLSYSAIFARDLTVLGPSDPPKPLPALVLSRASQDPGRCSVYVNRSTECDQIPRSGAVCIHSYNFLFKNHKNTQPFLLWQVLGCVWIDRSIKLYMVSTDRINQMKYYLGPAQEMKRTFPWHVKIQGGAKALNGI